MANSGIEWIDFLFDWAVIVLVETARLVGITYEEINVWLFVIAWTLITLGMMIVILVQRRELLRLKATLPEDHLTL